MNWAKSAPWYKRFVIGDQWPNKTSWYVLQAQIRGTHILVERHTRDCTCSYCRGEHGSGPLWLPQARGRGWRIINLFHRLYIRWC
ncbi:hypothetical protein ABIF68_007832 [Bradyrhizobium japonicum]